jgi:hypothetical protein
MPNGKSLNGSGDASDTFLRKYKEPEIGGDLPEKMVLKKKRPKKK